MLALTAAIVLLGVALMLVIAGNELDRQLNDRVETIDKQMEANFNQIRTDVRKELDARVPPGAIGGAVPTPTPPPPLATTSPTPSPSPTATASPSPEAGTTAPKEP
jgi:hypothetical protein